LFGQKVVVHQCGETDTTRWALVSSVVNQEFRYRLPQQWLKDTPPPPVSSFDRRNQNLPLTIDSLANLGRFVFERSQPKSIDVLRGERECEKLCAPNVAVADVEENGCGQGADDMDVNPKLAPRVVELEIAGSADSSKRGEQ
jgi:hypothetical protein